MNRLMIAVILAVCPSAGLAFCGDFVLGVAPGFGGAEWASKLPLLFVILTLCLAPIYFFLKRFSGPQTDA